MKSTKRSAKTQKGTLLLIALVALVALAGVLEAKRKVVENQLEQVTVRLEQMQTGSTRQDREKAARIVEKVRRLMEIGDIEPTVATIVDVEKLRERNPFYKMVQQNVNNHTIQEQWFRKQIKLYVMPKLAKLFIITKVV